MPRCFPQDVASELGEWVDIKCRSIGTGTGAGTGSGTGTCHGNDCSTGSGSDKDYLSTSGPATDTYRDRGECSSFVVQQLQCATADNIHTDHTSDTTPTTATRALLAEDDGGEDDTRTRPVHTFRIVYNGLVVARASTLSDIQVDLHYLQAKYVMFCAHSFTRSDDSTDDDEHFDDDDDNESKDSETLTTDEDSTSDDHYSDIYQSLHSDSLFHVDDDGAKVEFVEDQRGETEAKGVKTMRDEKEDDERENSEEGKREYNENEKDSDRKKDEEENESKVESTNTCSRTAATFASAPAVSTSVPVESIPGRVRVAPNFIFFLEREYQTLHVGKQHSFFSFKPLEEQKQHIMENVEYLKLLDSEVRFLQ